MNLFAPHAHSSYAASVLLYFMMMVVMMMPALMPWLRLFSRMAGDAYPGRRTGLVVGQFIAGYLVIWLTYSAAAATVQDGLQYFALLRLNLSVGMTVGGILLITAGLFQLTSLKEACLAHCRSPLSFFLARWDGGPRGPFKMGAHHGGWCVGCCWALMVLSFVLGAMNLLWMAILTAMIVAEQRAPRRWHLSRCFGIAFIAWGVALIVIS